MRKILLACCMLLSFYSYGQKNIEISLQQDVKLLFFGDKKGNDPLTVNLLSKIEIPFYNFKKNYLSAYISVEYADLIGKNYMRYAIGTGYIVNNIYKKIGVGAYLDFGKIYRQNQGFYSYSLSGELNYKVNNRLKFICTHQLTQRKDLTVLYSTHKKYKISGFIGMKYSL